LCGTFIFDTQTEKLEMKQFECQFRNGSSQRYSMPDISMKFPLSVSAVRTLAVGAKVADRDGDIWTRLPDLGSTKADEPSTPDNRLERFATAALVALVPLSDLLDARGTSPAKEALRHARELIAELDAST
jgi:hypothetical protein